MPMLSLAVVMLIKPALLNDVRQHCWFAAAALATALILAVDRRFRATQPDSPGRPGAPQ